MRHEIFDAGGLSEGCELEPGGQPFAIAFGVRRENDPPDRFLIRLTTVDQQTEAILKAKVFEGGICATVNGGWHGSNALVVPDNLSLLTLPPYSPDPGSSPGQALNPVENVWAYLRANKLAISVFESYDDIVDACCNAWNFFANDPNAIASITQRSWAEVS